jgi:HSP20 family protein
MNTVAEKETHPATQETPRAINYITPEVNIFETKDAYVLEAEIPGVNRAGLDISVEDNVLTIIGRRQPADSKAELLHRESSSADYRRSFELDPAIDTDKIDAKVEQGVLTVHLPKSDRAKPRKITVID